MHSFPNVSPTIQLGARSKSSRISVPHGPAARRTVTPSAPSCQKRGGLAIAPTCGGEGDRRRPGISSVQPVFRTQKRVPRLPNRLVFDSRGRFSRQPPPAGCDRRPPFSSRPRPVPGLRQTHPTPAPLPVGYGRRPSSHADCGRPSPQTSAARHPTTARRIRRPLRLARASARPPRRRRKPTGSTRLTSSRTGPLPSQARARCLCAGGTRPRTRRTRCKRTPGPPRRSSRNFPARDARRRTAPRC